MIDDYFPSIITVAIAVAFVIFIGLVQSCTLKEDAILSDCFLKSDSDFKAQLCQKVRA